MANVLSNPFIGPAVRPPSCPTRPSTCPRMMTPLAIVWSPWLSAGKAAKAPPATTLPTTTALKAPALNLRSPVLLAGGRTHTPGNGSGNGAGVVVENGVVGPGVGTGVGAGVSAGVGDGVGDGVVQTPQNRLAKR